MAKKNKETEPYNVQEYLSSAGVSRSIAKFKKDQVIFSQDDPCDEVLYLQSGNAKLSIVNPQGKEAVLAIVGPGDFLGEGCIIGNPVGQNIAGDFGGTGGYDPQPREFLHEQIQEAGIYSLQRRRDAGA
jgi:CRP-like cAMP-binding protein